MAVTRASSAAAASSRQTLPTAKIKKEKQNKFKRNMSPGIRIIGGRIYDSVNGKTCHQCRQKTIDFSVSCKNIAEKKQCTFHYCHICLMNRYGEKAEEAAALGCNWKCPSCRGDCNCSRCMKHRGCGPTGILLPTAKANGFSSVSEMLYLEGIKKAEIDEDSLMKKRKALNEETAASSKIDRRKAGLDERANSMCLPRSSKSKGNMRENMTSKMPKTGKTDGKDNFAKGKTKGDSTSVNRITHGTSTLMEADANDNFDKGEIAGVATVEKRVTRSTATLRKVPMGQEEVEARAKDELMPHGKTLTQLSGSKDIEAKKTVNKNATSFAAEKTVGNVQLRRNSGGAIDFRLSNVNNLLPQGTNLSKVANLDFAGEDVGHALQFLEFCEAFGQVLDLKKGQPEFLLQELMCCLKTRRRCDFSLERLHIKLLSMIQKDSEDGCSSLKTRGRNSWLEALMKHISGCPYMLKELDLNCSHLSLEGYEKLKSSKKLRILTFLCDEALSTSELRIWIDEKNVEFVEEKKKAKKMLLLQEKNAGMKLKDEVAKAILLKNGATLSIAEHQNLVLKIKEEALKSLPGKYNPIDYVAAATSEVKQSAVVRSVPIFSDAYGRKFWKLKSHSGEMNVLLQDVASQDQITSEEKWFVYDIHEREDIERYISSVKGASLI